MKTIEETRRGMFEAQMEALGKNPGQWLGDKYSNTYGDAAFIGFNAALDAVVIELPELAEPREPAYAFDDSWRDGYTAASRYRRQCRAAIESTNLGLKIR
jgi:hypothetical protein